VTFFFGAIIFSFRIELTRVGQLSRHPADAVVCCYTSPRDRSQGNLHTLAEQLRDRIMQLLGRRAPQERRRA
jgi:hypothetical protein